MEKGINKDEFLLVIEKVKMYRDEEASLIEKIRTELNQTYKNYQDKNYQTLLDKINSLYLDFDTSIKNKDRYIDFLYNVVSSYEKEEEAMKEITKVINTDIS